MNLGYYRIIRIWICEILEHHNKQQKPVGVVDITFYLLQDGIRGVVKINDTPKSRVSFLDRHFGFSSPTYVEYDAHASNGTSETEKEKIYGFQILTSPDGM